jgi:transmembrane sensor
VCPGLPLAAYSGWNLGWLPNSYQHFEATDSVRQVTLQDGSQVELNLGSELTYSHYKDQRRVTLKTGEAFFSVTHDTTHPFVVKAGEGKIRVTGTRFNVWMYEDQVKVNLIEGSVLVSSHDDPSGDGVRLGLPCRQAINRVIASLASVRLTTTTIRWPGVAANWSSTTWR